MCGNQTLVLFFTEIQASTDMSGDGIANIQMSMLKAPEVKADITYGSGLPVTIEYFPDDTFNYSTAWNNYLTGSSIVEGGFENPEDNKYVLPDVHRLVIKKYTVKIERV